MTTSTHLTAWPTDSSTLRQFLGISPGAKFRCHGKTKVQKPCKNPIRQDISNQVSILLAQITKCGSFKPASTLLEEVARLIMCHCHYSEDGPIRFKAWEAKLTALEPSVKIEHDSDGAALASIYPKSATLLRQEIKVETAALDTTVKKEEGTPTHTSTALKVSKSKKTKPILSGQPTQHKFEAFHNPVSTVVINKDIRDIIKRGPCKKEKESSGSVYVYTFPNNYHDPAPYLKIGNSKDVNDRMRTWQRRCGYKPKILADFPADLFVKVERLVHVTLHNERMREPSCPRCGTQHFEWFNVRNSKASSIIATWTSWTRQEPYNQDGTLKMVWLDRLKRVDLTDPHCWQDFVDGKLDGDDSSEGSDLELLEGIDLSDFSDDELY